MKEIKNSSNIEAIGYKNGILSVQFKSGGLYHYEDVTPEQHRAFMAADSYGKHHREHIHGKFTYTRAEKK